MPFSGASCGCRGGLEDFVCVYVMVRVLKTNGPLFARVCADGSGVDFAEKPGLEVEGSRRGLQDINIALSASASAQNSIRA